MSITKEQKVVLSLVLLKFLMHMLTMHHYELQRDAYLYYTLGEHLDWGFVSVPPFIAILAKFSTTVFGNTVFALRIFPALIGSISVYIIYKMVKEFKGGLVAVLFACLAFIISPAFLRSNSLFQPVSFNQFSWLLSTYFLVLLINRKDPKWWYWVMLVWIIGFYNKYAISFYIISILAGLLLSGHYKLFLSKHFYISGGLALGLILPNIFWQYQHNWPLLTHMHELARYQLVNVTVSGFLIDQLVMNLPALILWISALYFVMLRKEFKAYRFIIIAFFILLLILLLLSGKSYYALGIYSALFALGGVVVERYFSRGMRLAKLAFMLLFFVLMVPLSIPVLSLEKVEEYSKTVAPMVNRWEDGQVHQIPQDFADMTGWKELGEKVSELYVSPLNVDRENCIIYAENYGQAGAINFYGKKYNLPEVISFNDNFILWAPDSIAAGPLIYVNDEIGDIEFLYDSIQLVATIDDEYFREQGLQVYYCTSMKAVFPGFYKEKVAELKSAYKIK